MPARDPDAWTSATVRALVMQLQAAHHGNPALDLHVAEVLARGAACPAPGGPAEDGPRWSSDLNQVLTLIPDHYNFSMGQRDGVCWAWIQPNDDWEPGENEARHDHPRGSGLVVAPHRHARRADRDHAARGAAYRECHGPIGRHPLPRGLRSTRFAAPAFKRAKTPPLPRQAISPTQPGRLHHG